MSVDEFLLLPEPSDGSYYELHDGDIVTVTAPKRPHVDLQYRLTTLLATIARESYVVRPELPFRATPVDFFRADVGVVSHHRYDTVVDYLAGSPDMVIEVECPSDTPAELDGKEAVCLANGCREFWVIYPQKRYVRVATGDTTKRYREGDAIPLTLFPGQSLNVSEIFSILPSSSRD